MFANGLFNTCSGMIQHWENYISNSFQWMGYDRGDSFPFDFEPNGIPFGSKSKVNCHHDHIPFTVKWNGNIVFSEWW